MEEGSRTPPLWPDDALSRHNGCYRSLKSTEDWDVELRVDVAEGYRWNGYVSGDIYDSRSGVRKYAGSFFLPRPIIKSASPWEIEGYPLHTPDIRIAYIRLWLDYEASPLRPLMVLGLARQAGDMMIIIRCVFHSEFFRTVEYELDHTTGIEPFSYYDSSWFPSAGPPRVLTLESAFAEAGIKLERAGQASEVPGGAPDFPHGWTNDELNNCMREKFSLIKDEPQWKVWMLATTWMRDKPGVYGRMFDFDNGPYQRQGCALFHSALAAAENEEQALRRRQLRAYVHELGHCFNLKHSHEKGRENALSWMREVPDDGWTDFWKIFPFRFDALEIAHLRHGFLPNVMMGANAYGEGHDSIFFEP